MKKVIGLFIAVSLFFVIPLWWSIPQTVFAAGLPTIWSQSDLSPNGHISGSASFSHDVFTVSGSGDIWASFDQAHFVYQELPGNGSIVARITSQSGTSNGFAKEGVMIKQSTQANSPYVLIAATPGTGVRMQYNYNTDIAGGSYTFPVWLKIQRVGNTVSTYQSTNGYIWTQVGSTQAVSLTGTALIGLLVSSNDGNVLSTATFDHVWVAGGVPSFHLPTPWVNTDIGNPTPTGLSVFTDGTFIIKGGGNDIWATTDQLQYAYQPVSGNATIRARVTGQTNTSEWAKSGIMFKDSATTGANYVSLFVTPGHGIHFQYNFNGDQGGTTYYFPNAYLKLNRNGNTFTAYTSSDGHHWTVLGTVTQNLQNTATVGLFVNSHNGNALCTSTFDNVYVSQP